MATESLRKNYHRYKKVLIFLLLLGSGSVFYWLLVRIGLIFPLWDLPEILCITNCQNEEQLHSPPTGNEFLNYNQLLDKLLPSARDKDKISILIEKSKHRLTIFYDKKPIKSYPVVFGEPLGDKLGQGDKKTPEGILQIQDLYPHPSWSKFMWLNYPNPQSWRKHLQAKTSGQLPWNVAIGGEVGIHGVPYNADNLIENRENWTLGCPSLKNQDVDEIYQWVQKGTVVEILP
ncbi:MAG TPA: L,D-transpeptidase [Nostocaceae cyanobacterium]|nr:L,D-transpeptidase [Nostocaceae cyanobacterium]